MRPVIESESSSPNAPPGVQFSEEKQSKIIAPISIGEGILGKNDPSPPKEKTQTKQNKNIEKANSLLDELSREERSGMKAEINALDQSDNSFEKQRLSKDKDDRTNSALTDKNRKQKSDRSDNYEDEFEEIDEDLPDNELDLSHNVGLGGKIGESHGVTVS